MKRPLVLGTLLLAVAATLPGARAVVDADTVHGGRGAGPADRVPV
jgi:hypothetical protein